MKIVAGLLSVFLVSLVILSPLSADPGEVSNDKAAIKADDLSGIVVDEQGSPLDGADVVYSWWANRENKTVAAKSDAQGHFTLSAPNGRAWQPGEIWAVVKGRCLASELLYQDGKPPEKELRLVLPTPAPVIVLVVGPDGKPVSGAKISLGTLTEWQERYRFLPKLVQQLSETASADDGKATLTALKREELSQIRVTTTQYGIQLWDRIQPDADVSQPLRITLRATGRVRGRLRAPATDLVEGATISVASHAGGQVGIEQGQTLGVATTTADKEGRFEIPVVAAGTLRSISVLPTARASEKASRRFLPVPPDEAPLASGQTIELNIEFKPAVRVHGTVRLAGAGGPVSGAVLALFRERGGSYGAARSDANGRFEFILLPGPHTLQFWSIERRDLPGWFRSTDFYLPSGNSEHELPPIELAVARGRVADGAGKGIAGVKVEKAVTKTQFQGAWVESSVNWHEEPRELFTDANGEYRAWVEVGATYRAQFAIEGRAPQWTEWVTFKSDEPAVFPDLVVDTLQSIAGRVVDRQGKPVAGVTVFQSGDGPHRTEVATDGEGRFRLDGYQFKAGYLFTEKAGYRFHGQPVTVGADEVDVVLTRTSEEPPRRLATLAESDAAAETTLAMRVLKPVVDRLPKADEHERWVVLRELAQVDPGAALDQVETLKMRGLRADSVRAEIVKQWAEKHPDDAVAIVEAFDNAYSRTVGYFQAAEALPASLRERKLDWLGKARLHLRGISDNPAMRTALAAGIARRLYECGDVEQSRQILAEIRPGVEKMPLDSFSAYVRGATAEALAVFDLPAALAVIQDLKNDREYNRHHGNIARIMAAVKPAESFRALKLVRDDFNRDQYAVYVAHLMAPVNRQRASEAAELISRLNLQAHAHGLMALALLRTDTGAAREELDRAYALLSKQAGSDTTPTYGYHAGPAQAAWLLPLVEKLRPDQVEEHLWRAISLRVPLAKHGDYAPVPLRSRALLSMLLARYDRDLALALYGDLDAEVAKLNPGDRSNASADVFAALAMIDPARAVALYEKLPDDLPYNTKKSVRQALVRILSTHGEARWQAAANHLQAPMPWHEIQ